MLCICYQFCLRKKNVRKYKINKLYLNFYNNLKYIYCLHGLVKIFLHILV